MDERCGNVLRLGSTFEAHHRDWLPSEAVAARRRWRDRDSHFNGLREGSVRK